MTLKQKSRLQRLKSGDSNNKLFFAAVKERHKTNRIYVLLDDNNVKLEKPEEIQTEVFKFIPLCLVLVLLSFLLLMLLL